MLMGIRLLAISFHAKQLVRSMSHSTIGTTRRSEDVPRGHFAVYVGEESYNKHRFVVPICYLKHPLFQELLKKAEEEYGFDHPMGGLTIPCSEDAFLRVASHLKESTNRRRFH